MPQIVPAKDALSFNPVRELLNPKFESYKLDPSAPAPVSHPLPAGTSVGLSSLPDSARLSLVESQARARHNYLCANDEGVVLFIDSEYNLVLVSLDSSLRPSFKPVLQLPVPMMASSSTGEDLLEYPDAVCVPGSSMWCVTDGAGRLHGIKIASDASSASIKWSRELLKSDDSNNLRPFRMHSVDKLKNGKIVALISSVVKLKKRVELPSKEQTAHGKAKTPSTTAFEYMLVELPSVDDSNEGQALRPSWMLHSHDLPSFIHFDAEKGAYAITAASLLTEDAPQVIGASHHHFPHHEEEDEPSQAGTSSATKDKTVETPPPFSWSQDSDSLTVVFAIPSDTPTASIRITFSRQFVSLFVGSPSAAIRDEPSKLPQISHKKLWDSIDHHTSVWTFDRDAEGRNSSYGLLSLHLEKANAGTRWTDVFAASLAPSETDRLLEHVPETLDPSELAAISEKMEQWSRDVGAHLSDRVGGDMPASLMGDEIDVEIDASAGRPLYITWIAEVSTQSGPTLKHPHPTVPFSLLSTPLPGTSSSDIVISHDVDGLLFKPDQVCEPWVHETTFPALSFVLATKQNARFVHHIGQELVLAFDSPWHSQYASPEAARNAGAGNLFVYERPAGGRDQKGKQRVYRVGSSSSGQLKGVVGVRKDGQTVVLALCERELVVFAQV